MEYSGLHLEVGIYGRYMDIAAYVVLTPNMALKKSYKMRSKRVL